MNDGKPVFCIHTSKSLCFNIFGTMIHGNLACKMTSCAAQTSPLTLKVRLNLKTTQELVGGLEHFIFSHILGIIIIPIDFHIFQRGGQKPPNQTIVSFLGITVSIFMGVSIKRANPKSWIHGFDVPVHKNHPAMNGYPHSWTPPHL